MLVIHRSLRLGLVIVVLAAACSDSGSSQDGGPANADGGGDPGASDGGEASDGIGSERAPDPTLTPNEKMLVDLPADSWLKVPVGYAAQCDDTFAADWHAVSGCSALISAWSSGVWDPARRQMLVFGGGHNDYAGNEVYAFSAKTLTWTRLTQPSPKPYNKDPLDDGKPVSRHTYDGLTWIDHETKMLAWGGARSNDGNGTNVTWLFDPALSTWSSPSGSSVPPSSYDHSIVYDPVTKKAFVKVVQNLFSLDPGTNAWTLLHDLGYPPLWPRYAGGNPRGALDTKRRNVWYVGGNLYMIYAIDTDKTVTDDWVTTGGGAFDNAAAVTGHPEQRIQTGGGDVISKGAPGLDYDARADQMVAWVGGGPHVLDLATKAWTRKSGADAPTAPTGTGTYGRWRYLPEYNVFVLVTTPDAVYFYKNTAGP